MKQKICVTGATGSIGHKLVIRLLKEGFKVRAIVRNEGNVSQLKATGVEIAVADLGKPAMITGLLDDCFMVYHTAAKVVGLDSSDFWQTNVEGTTLLLEEAVRAQITRFVHISSVAVYGYPNDKDVAEDYSWRSNEDLYITTKQAAEKIIWNRSRDVPVTIIRPGEVIGPDQLIWTTKILFLISLGLLHAPKNPGYLNPVYIDNLIDALVLLGFHPTAIGHAFNVVDGYLLESSQYIRSLARIANRIVVDLPPRLLQLAASAFEHYHLPGETEPLLTKASVNFLLHKTSFSNEKIRSGFGWVPSVDLETALDNIAEWYKQSKGH